MTLSEDKQPGCLYALAQLGLVLMRLVATVALVPVVLIVALVATIGRDLEARSAFIGWYAKLAVGKPPERL